MTNCQVIELGLEENITSLPYRANRVGAAINPNRQLPHDIIFNFADSCTKKKFIKTARSKGALYYERKQIVVFPILMQAALHIHKDYKPLTTQLNTHNPCYKWITSSRIHFTYKEKSFDFETGQNFQIPFSCFFVYLFDLFSTLPEVEGTKTNKNPNNHKLDSLAFLEKNHKQAQLHLSMETGRIKLHRHCVLSDDTHVDHSDAFSALVDRFTYTSIVSLEIKVAGSSVRFGGKEMGSILIYLLPLLEYRHSTTRLYYCKRSLVDW